MGRDSSESGPRNASDLLIADAADCQLLDDQSVQDILETGAFYLPDQSTGDSRNEKDKADLSRTDVRDYDADATSTVKARETRAMLEEITEGTAALSPYQPEAAPVSWAQRVLSWFRK